MRFIVGLLIVIMPGSVHAVLGQFAPDEKEVKDPGRAADDPFGIRAEQMAWQDWLKALGPGPVYRVEALYRYAEDDRLYYLRTLISTRKPNGDRMFGLGVDDKGRPIAAPNPGYVDREIAQTTTRAEPRGQKPIVPPPPLASKTRLIGVSLDPVFVKRPGELMIRESDLATTMALPTTPGTSSVGFRQAIFIVELLSADQLANQEPLRQDPTLYRQRKAELVQLLLTTHRDKLLKSEHALSHGVNVTHDAKLLQEVRTRLQAWIAKPTAEVAGRGFPTSLAGTLQRHGTADDFALFNQLAKSHPDSAGHLLWNTLYLAQRVGGARAVPVWTALVRNRQARDREPTIERLRALVPAIPEPIQGDLAVVEMVQVFKLDPVDFHLQRAETGLLERAEQARLTRQEKELFLLFQKNPTTGHLLFMTEADRKRGHEAAMKWLVAYQPH